MKTYRSFLGVIVIAGLTLTMPQIASAAHAHAKEGGWFNKKTDSTQPWFRFDKAWTAKVSWTTGPNSIDGAGFAAYTYPPEDKFNRISGTIVGRTFTGYTFAQGPGSRGSFFFTDGTGNSGVGAVVYYANINVTATGIVGAAPPPPAPEWSAESKGLDPWPLYSDDFPGPNESFFDMFVPLEIGGGDPGNGEIRWHNYFETSDSIHDWIDVKVSPTDVQVAGGAGVSFYLLPEFDATPLATPANQVTTAWIHDYLYNQLLATGTITQPLKLGMMMTHIPIPTTDMGDGVRAQMHGDVEARDHGTVPEPASFLPLALGLGLCLRRMRR